MKVLTVLVSPEKMSPMYRPVLLISTAETVGVKINIVQEKVHSCHSHRGLTHTAGKRVSETEP